MTIPDWLENSNRQSDCLKQVKHKITLKSFLIGLAQGLSVFKYLLSVFSLRRYVNCRNASSVNVLREAEGGLTITSKQPLSNQNILPTCYSKIFQLNFCHSVPNYLPTQPYLHSHTCPPVPTYTYLPTRTYIHIPTHPYLHTHTYPPVPTYKYLPTLTY